MVREPAVRLQSVRQLVGPGRGASRDATLCNALGGRFHQQMLSFFTQHTRERVKHSLYRNAKLRSEEVEHHVRQGQPFREGKFIDKGYVQRHFKALLFRGKLSTSEREHGRRGPRSHADVH